MLLLYVCVVFELKNKVEKKLKSKLKSHLTAGTFSKEIAAVNMIKTGIKIATAPQSAIISLLKQKAQNILENGNEHDAGS